jgi:transposase
MRAAAESIDINMKELESILEQARESLGEDGYKKLKAALDTLEYVSWLVAEKKITVQELRELLLGPSSEKTEKILNKVGIESSHKENKSADREIKSKPKGHGRNGARSYKGAPKTRVAHPILKPGKSCPLCPKGKVYRQGPGLLVRMAGQAPLAATVYELEKLRCNLCGEVFTAEAPEGVGSEKYDESSASMIALLKYGSGFPFYRLEGLQERLGIPLPASTQWEIVEETARVIQPALDELIRQAAQGEVLHNDDTSMRVMSLMKDASERDSSKRGERTGVFTSGIVSTREGQRIALFFTGRKHAGENLGEVLKERAAELPPPIQMCDALSRNLPKHVDLIVAHCLAHGRRRFVKAVTSFPQECRYVLETLGKVYYNDDLAREGQMSADERLNFHKTESGPLMDNLHTWLIAQLEEKRVEPNSGLGEAISYLLKYWTKLTLFLRQSGAPLDNNVVERGLKKAILHRKNALFYKTTNGAQVGDLFMSLIHSSELAGANPFDYLTELQKHFEDLAANPSQWMPWNYRQRLEPAAVAVESG